MVKIYEEYDDDDSCIRETSNFTTNDLSKHWALWESVKFMLEGLFWFDYKKLNSQQIEEIELANEPGKCDIARTEYAERLLFVVIMINSTIVTVAIGVSEVNSRIYEPLVAISDCSERSPWHSGSSKRFNEETLSLLQFCFLLFLVFALACVSELTCSKKANDSTCSFARTYF